MYLIQIKHAQIKFPLFGFWTVHVGAAGASAVAAAGAVAALAFAESSVTAVLTSVQNVRRRVQRPLPGLDVVPEV